MRGKHNRGVAQLASASGLGPEGPVFESQYPDIEEQSFRLLFFSCTKFDNFAEGIHYYDTGKGNREVLWDTEGAERN